MASLRILQIVDNLGMGGAETWMIELLRFWSKTSKHQVDFLLTGGRPGIFDAEARSLGSRIYYARYSRSRLLEFGKEFRRILRANSYDAVHDHQDYVAGWHFLIGLGVLPPVRIVHVHNPWMHIEVNYAVNWRRKLSTLLGKLLTSSLASHICGTSAEVLYRYGFDPGTSDVSVLHCGFDVARFSIGRDPDRELVRSEFGWPRAAKIVLFAGRLDRALQFDHPQNHKNSWFALNVVRTAIAKDPSVRLLMAGAGEARGSLQEEVRGWSLDDKLYLLGVRADIPRLMRAADILLFPSRQEGLGMVAVEAQAAGLPVLASTAVPRECIVITELYNTLPLNQPAAVWADKLLDIMYAPRMPYQTCRDMIEASAFSIANSASSLEGIYGSATRG